MTVAPKYDLQEVVLIDQMKMAFNLDYIISLDFETFYGRGYGLKNKTYAEYIMDERFKSHMLGVGVDAMQIDVLDTHEIEEWAENIKHLQEQGYRVGIIAQNTHFDAAILCWRYGLKFDFYFDSMLLSRLRYINLSASLKNHAQRVWPDNEDLRKGDGLAATEGVRDLHEVDGLYANTTVYCGQDVNLTRKLVLHHWNTGMVTMTEWYLMHITLRGCIEPQFWVNQTLLQEVTIDEEALKIRLVEQANDYLRSIDMPAADAAMYASNVKYKDLIERLGANIPYKLDPEDFTMKPALGKTDPEYVKFQQEHSEHAPIFAARERIKSTIAVSRAKRLTDTANQLSLEGFIPFPLNYHKAHTGRWSGGEKMNVQNLQRGSKHRLSLTAPKGYKVLVRDLSGIELRMNIWFCEQDDLLDVIRAGGDLYCLAAESIYNYPVNKKDHPDERQIGKVATLGMGYGMGWKTFQAYMAGGPMGMDPVFFPDSFCRQTKAAYDLMNPMVKQMWHYLNNVVIPAMCDASCDMTVGRYGCVQVRHQKLILPSGRELQYPGLHADTQEDRFGFNTVYKYDDGTRDRYKRVVWKKLYGGLLLENIIQALARDVIGDHIVLTERDLIETKAGWVVGSIHDEILALVKTALAQQSYDRMGAIMATPPQWCFDIPLASEGGFDDVYSK